MLPPFLYLAAWRHGVAGVATAAAARTGAVALHASAGASGIGMRLPATAYLRDAAPAAHTPSLAGRVENLCLQWAAAAAHAALS